MLKILIVDDSKQITSILENYAKKEGYDTVVAYDGEQALEQFYSEHPDVLLLDVMMPKLDGFQVCKEIRKTSNVPILLVTARGEDFERIMGLEIGADDYIVKPFSPGEVIARIKAIMRRVSRNTDEKSLHAQSEQILYCENLTVNLDDYTAAIDDNPISLTKKEIEILWTLAQNTGKVFSRNHLLNSLWGYDYFGDSRTVDSHIKRLRAKLDAYPHEAWEIKTIWGVGYKFDICK